MKKWMAYILSLAVSAALCGVILFFPVRGITLWQHPCVNGYSLFAAAFFVMNTIGLCAMAGDRVFWKKPYTEERPAIEAQKRYVTAVVVAFFEIPLLATVFFVEGGWKMAVCSVLFVGGSLILAGLIGDISAEKLRKEYKRTEQQELADQLRKEEGL